jgi:hypothetical protein
MNHFTATSSAAASGSQNEMSRYCKHGIDPMHCAADECQPPAKGKAQGPLGAAACSTDFRAVAIEKATIAGDLLAANRRLELENARLHLEIAGAKSKLAEAVSIARQGRYTAMDFVAVGRRLDAMDDYLSNETAHLTAEKGTENEK